MLLKLRMKIFTYLPALRNSVLGAPEVESALMYPEINGCVKISFQLGQFLCCWKLECKIFEVALALNLCQPPNLVIF